MSSSHRALLHLLLVALATTAGGCDLIVGATVVPGSETLPAPGYIHIEGEPAIAQRALMFRLVGSDGVPSQVTDITEAGVRTVVDRTTLPGSHTLMVNDLQCAGSFIVESDKETDLLVRIDAEACAVSVVRTHQPGVITH